MKKYLVLFTALFMLFSNHSYSQHDFRKGYVLKTEFDTLYGEINNRSYYENSRLCEFKDLNTNTITNYRPGQIYGYRFIDGKYYISKKVGGLDIFMEYLINGSLDIYFYQDYQKANHYYVAKDTSELNELKYYEYTKQVDGKTMRYKSKPYIGVLNYYTSDCPSLNSEITGMDEPDHENLIDIANKYHALTCEGEKCIVYEKKIPRNIILCFQGGPIFYYSDDFISGQKVYPSFGFNILFQQAMRHERLYLGLGLFSSGDLTGENSLYRVPLSINYLSPRPGFSPIFSYQFDLNYYILTQALNAGLKYKMKKISIYTIAQLNTYALIKPYATSVEVGISFDIQ